MSKQLWAFDVSTGCLAAFAALVAHRAQTIKHDDERHKYALALRVFGAVVLATVITTSVPLGLERDERGEDMPTWLLAVRSAAVGVSVLTLASMLGSEALLKHSTTLQVALFALCCLGVTSAFAYAPKGDADRITFGTTLASTSLGCLCMLVQLAWVWRMFGPTMQKDNWMSTRIPNWSFRFAAASAAVVAGTIGVHLANAPEEVPPATLLSVLVMLFVASAIFASSVTHNAKTDALSFRFACFAFLLAAASVAVLLVELVSRK